MQYLKKLFIDKIKDINTQDIAIVMHNKPDADAIGSAIALEEYLLQIGKDVDVIFHDKIAERFSPIVGKKRINKKIFPPIGKMYDLTIMVDFSDPHRGYEGLFFLSNYIIVLDHHVENKPYGDLYICENAASTGVIIYNLLKDEHEHSPLFLNSIYLTIASDTSNFKNSNSDSESFLISSLLIEKGADVELVNKILNEKSIEFIKLMGYTLSYMEYDNFYNINYLIVTREMINKSGASGEEVASLIDQIKCVKNADITYLFIEGLSNVRVSARSKKTSVNKIMRNFGGGGHKLAAGCAISGVSLDIVVNNVLNLTRHYIDKKESKNENN